jgi:hypothetical protein
MVDRCDELTEGVTVPVERGAVSLDFAPLQTLVLKLHAQRPTRP